MGSERRADLVEWQDTLCELAHFLRRVDTAANAHVELDEDAELLRCLLLLQLLFKELNLLEGIDADGQGHPLLLVDLDEAGDLARAHRLVGEENVGDAAVLHGLDLGDRLAAHAHGHGAEEGELLLWRRYG